MKACRYSKPLLLTLQERSSDMQKDLISISDLNRAEVEALFDTTYMLKTGAIKKILYGKTLAMVFEKPSLRTRVTFEVGMNQLEGNAIYLSQADIKLGGRESVSDAARNLERWVDGIVARTFKHETVVELADNSGVPVINALSDLEHPCQALADFFTIMEKKQSVNGLKLAFVGDGNNVCNSLILLSAIMGAHFVVACPERYDPNRSIVEHAQQANRASGGKLEIVHDPEDAAKDADVIYTDVWVSMGDETETERRMKDFKGFQVNGKLLSRAKPDVIVMHCLPAKRGVEISDEVIDGPHSVVFDQAENRLHIQKAILVHLLIRGDGRQMHLFGGAKRQ